MTDDDTIIEIKRRRTITTVKRRDPEKEGSPLKRWILTPVGRLIDNEPKRSKRDRVNA